MLEELKERVCKANKDLVKYNLVLFTWGNVSEIDFESKIVGIKPSGVSFETLTAEDIVLLNLDGKVVEGSKNPSSDTPTHLELYKNFPEIKAIVHTHSTFATAFAQGMKELECLGTTHADTFYGSVPVTRKLSKEEINGDYEGNTGAVIVKHFSEKGLNPKEMPACLVAGHGPFVFGNSTKEAVENAVILEQLAKMNIETKKVNKEVGPIDSALLDKHFLRKHGKNAYYGQGK